MTLPVSERYWVPIKLMIILALPLLLCTVAWPARDSSQSLFESSSKKMQAGDYAGAEAGFLKILQSEPNNVSALGNLGIIYTRTQRYARAIQIYQKALRISPNEHGILLNLGLAYLREDDYDRARPHFRKLHTLDPKDVQAANLLATCMVYGGQPNAGIEVLKPFLNDNPDKGTLYLMGVAYARTGRVETSNKVFEGLFPDAATTPQSRFLLGQAHYDSLRFALAERDFQDLLAMAPAYPGAHRALGKDFLSDHRYEDAEEQFRAALEQDPGDVAAVYLLGALLTQTEKYADSIPYLERARQADPASWSTLFYLGKAQLKLNELDASIKTLKAAVDLKPDEAVLYYQLGTAYRRYGRAADARAAFQRVSELKRKGLDAQIKASRDLGIVGVR